MKKVFAISLFYLLFVGRIFSQTGCCPFINSIKISPTYPTNTDTILIITSTTTANLSIPLSYNYNLNSDSIKLAACYFEGMLPSLKTYFDTTVVGMLASGFYHVNYHAFLSSASTSCEVIDSNSMKISFFVAASSGIENYKMKEDFFCIFPNPFTSQTNFQTEHSFHNATFVVENYLGQTVGEIKDVSGKTVTLTNENLPVGLYLVRLVQDNKIIATKKLLLSN